MVCIYIICDVKRAYIAVQAMESEVGDLGYSSTCEAICHWHVPSEDDLNSASSGAGASSGTGVPSATGAFSSPLKHQRFRISRLQFASPYVAALVAQHCSFSARRDCEKFLLTEHRKAGMGSVFGTQFENLVHATLPHVPRGGFC